MATQKISPGQVFTINVTGTGPTTEVVALDTSECDAITVSSEVADDDITGLIVQRALKAGGTFGVGAAPDLIDADLDQSSDLVPETSFVTGASLYQTPDGGRFYFKLNVEGTGFVRVLAFNSAGDQVTFSTTISGWGPTPLHRQTLSAYGGS